MHFISSQRFILAWQDPQFTPPNGTVKIRKYRQSIHFPLFLSCLSTFSLLSRRIIHYTFAMLPAQGEYIFLKHHKSLNRPSSHNAKLQITRPARRETRTISAAIMRMRCITRREKYSSIYHDHGNPSRAWSASEEEFSPLPKSVISRELPRFGMRIFPHMYLHFRFDVTINGILATKRI